MRERIDVEVRDVSMNTTFGSGDENTQVFFESIEDGKRYRWETNSPTAWDLKYGQRGTVPF